MRANYNEQYAEIKNKFYQELIGIVNDSNIRDAWKCDLIRILHNENKPYNKRITYQDIIKRMTMISRGTRIQVSGMKPCPFCGCDMELQEITMVDLKTQRYDPVPVKRHKNGCQLMFTGGAFIGQPETISGAVRKWNRRADIT